MRVVEVDVAVGLDAVAQHVLVVAPHEHVGQPLLDVFARDDAVVAVLVEQLDPVLEAVLVERHRVFRHQLVKAIHLMAPAGSTPIRSAPYRPKPPAGGPVTRGGGAGTLPPPPPSTTAPPAARLRAPLFP